MHANVDLALLKISWLVQYQIVIFNSEREREQTSWGQEEWERERAIKSYFLEAYVTHFHLRVMLTLHLARFLSNFNPRVKWKRKRGKKKESEKKEKSKTGGSKRAHQSHEKHPTWDSEMYHVSFSFSSCSVLFYFRHFHQYRRQRAVHPLVHPLFDCTCREEGCVHWRAARKEAGESEWAKGK